MASTSAVATGRGVARGGHSPLAVGRALLFGVILNFSFSLEHGIVIYVRDVKVFGRGRIRGPMLMSLLAIYTRQISISKKDKKKNSESFT